MPSKYRAVKTTVDGIRFDSKREAARYQELKLLRRAKKIGPVALQPSFELQPKFTDGSGKKHRAINYVADFSYEEKGNLIIEDCKGVETAVFKLKRKLLMFKYPDMDFRIS